MKRSLKALLPALFAFTFMMVLIPDQAAACTRADPAVSMGSNQNIGAGDSIIYTVNITNNDTVACTATTFNVSILSEIESNAGSFILPSVLSSGPPCIVSSLSPGITDTSCTVTVTGSGSGSDGDTLDLTMRTSSGSHSNVDAAVTTTIGNILMHNSINLGSGKWAGDGGWGIAGGKYGAFTCETCHAMSTTSIKRIKENITAPNSPTDDFPGNAVIFTDPRDGSSDFGDDSGAHTTSQKICEVCHTYDATQTNGVKFHAYDMSAGGADLTHNNQTDCTTCHKHSDGFEASGECITCHNGVPGTTYVSRDVVGSDFTQASRHVFGGTVTNWDCIVCHREGDATEAASGSVSLTSLHKNSGGYVVDMRNVDSISTGWVWDKNNVTNAMHTDMDTFCMSCHDADGASGINVKATDDGVNLDSSRASTPFNSTDDVSEGVGGGTANVAGYERTAVLDVYTQFDPTNPSHHAVRGQAYTSHNANWGDTAWVDRTLQSSDMLITDGFYESAQLHCSDCHTVDLNAHGGSNGFMLQASSIDDTCYLCHNAATYSDNSSSDTRWDHSNDGGVWDTSKGSKLGQYGANAGSICLNCHGGNPVSDGFGGIHGLPSGTDTRSGQQRYRFMGGSYMSHSPSSWTGTSGGTPTCYFDSGSKNQDWSGCTQHSGTETGRTAAPQYSRGVPGDY